MTIEKEFILNTSIPVSIEVIDQFNAAMFKHNVLAYSSFDSDLTGHIIEGSLYIENAPGVDPTPKALKAFSELEWITELVIKNLEADENV